MGEATHCPRCGKECTPGGIFCPYCGTNLGDGETQPLAVAPVPRAPIGGKFLIVRELGRGGFGVVYEARDTALDRTVALKAFRRETFATEPERETFEKRFQREAKAVARLAHPNIVALYEAGQDQGLFYLAMEFVRGRTLRQVLAERGPLPAAEVREILKGLASALDHAHREGIVHRDIKPENVMIRDDGLLKVADFGVAKAVGVGTPTLTQAGSVMGTPSYMAPEQLQGLEVDGRADQFSTCAVAYEMLTGRRPFEADAMPALVYKIIHHAVPPPTTVSASTPADLSAVVMRGLAKDREERFASCAELSRALDTPGSVGTPPEAIPTVAVAAVRDLPTRAMAAPPSMVWRAGRIALLVVGAIVFVLMVATSRLEVTRQGPPGATPAASPFAAPAAPPPAADGTPDPRDAVIERLMSRLEALEKRGEKAPDPTGEAVDPATRQVLDLVASFQLGHEQLDVAAIMNLMHPEAEVVLAAGSLRSPDEIRDFYRLGFERIKAEGITKHAWAVENGSLEIGEREAQVGFAFDAGEGELPTTGRYTMSVVREGTGWRVRRIEKRLAGYEELRRSMDELGDAYEKRDLDLFAWQLALDAELTMGEVRTSGREPVARLYAGMFGTLDAKAPFTTEWQNVWRDEHHPSAQASHAASLRGQAVRWSCLYTFKKFRGGWGIAQIRDALPEELVATLGIPRRLASAQGRKPGNGVLSVVCRPPGVVQVNDFHVGSTPLLLEMPLGTPFQLSLSTSGSFAPHREDVTLTESFRDLAVTLRRE